MAVGSGRCVGWPVTFIRQLDNVDPDSMAFRYATTNSGKDHLPAVTHINIRHLREVLNSVFVWLNGTYGWIGEMEQGQSCD